MKKTWNKLIIVSFIVLAVVACAAIVFLYPYYNGRNRERQSSDAEQNLKSDLSSD